MSKKIAIWELGFRPLFLCGLFAASSLMALWLFFLRGEVRLRPYFEPSLWHGHEMIYGFVAAVIVGFILTASQNWTGIRGIRGWRLIFLALLWALGRFLMVLPTGPNYMVAAVDLAFIPFASLFLAPYLIRKDQKRNVMFLVLLSLLTFGNVLMHFDELGIIENYDRRGLYLGLHVVVLMIVIVGGRVIPFFSERADPTYRRFKSKQLDIATIASVPVFIVLGFFAHSSVAFYLSGAMAGILNLLRWLGWLDRVVWRIPILWILYFGYLWLTLGFFLSALGGMINFNLSTATHAFTVGAIGTMVAGMVSRVSLAHTGREIKASGFTVAGYLFVTLAALIRVFGPIIFPQQYFYEVQISGLLWIGAFILLFFTYLPILLSARLDGRDG